MAKRFCFAQNVNELSRHKGSYYFYNCKFFYKNIEKFLYLYIEKNRLFTASLKLKPNYLKNKALVAILILSLFFAFFRGGIWWEIKRYRGLPLWGKWV